MAQIVPLDAEQALLDWAPSHQSKLHASLITGRWWMGNKTWQKSDASASGCIGLTTSGGISLTSYSYIEQIRKTSFYVKTNYSSCLMWQGDGFCCLWVEELRIYTTSWITQRTERQTAITLSSMSPTLTERCWEYRKTTWLVWDLHDNPDLYPGFQLILLAKTILGSTLKLLIFPH